MPENYITLVDQIIAERHKKGMTQKDLAEATGFTQSVIARLESKKSMPTLNTLLKVTSALDTTLTIMTME